MAGKLAAVVHALAFAAQEASNIEPNYDSNVQIVKCYDPESPVGNALNVSINNVPKLCYIQCNAVLVTSDAVLTSAECFEKIEDTLFPFDDVMNFSFYDVMNFDYNYDKIESQDKGTVEYDYKDTYVVAGVEDWLEANEENLFSISEFKARANDSSTSKEDLAIAWLSKHVPDGVAHPAKLDGRSETETTTNSCQTVTIAVTTDSVNRHHSLLAYGVSTSKRSLLTTVLPEKHVCDADATSFYCLFGFHVQGNSLELKAGPVFMDGIVIGLLGRIPTKTSSGVNQTYETVAIRVANHRTWIDQKFSGRAEVPFWSVPQVVPDTGRKLSVDFVLQYFNNETSKFVPNDDFQKLQLDVEMKFQTMFRLGHQQKASARLEIEKACKHLEWTHRDTFHILLDDPTVERCKAVFQLIKARQGRMQESDLSSIQKWGTSTCSQLEDRKAEIEIIPIVFKIQNADRKLKDLTKEGSKKCDFTKVQDLINRTLLRMENAEAEEFDPEECWPRSANRPLAVLSDVVEAEQHVADLEKFDWTWDIAEKHRQGLLGVHHLEEEFSDRIIAVSKKTMHEVMP